MSIAEQIAREIEKLPAELQGEVLAFAKAMGSDDAAAWVLRESTSWSRFSLQNAMAGLENEPGPEYSRAGLKVSAA